MTSETFSGSVDTRLKKEKLVEIAKALALDPLPLTVKTLVVRIKKHLGEHPELAELPKFQGLFVYRATKVLSQKQAKRSTDKAAEDVEERKKGEVAVAGSVLVSRQS
ncbi:hypothetical protein HYPSUDRAFT_56658 [Hypholoma sublateritium FD-334 SS-4]|uniref:Uncharacterized protein n=1 Tax=Hypholoma sublateritium (strain FD-334 SS-4) TaxID=945553 RepID=A0A0D2NKF2_HYPSF|nr:hypothetical protein HYPSUDRAFT_56658 [Hypholoma sublateritium FD-334 SS-4]